ncbi:MAG: HEAT repeat domain-containing protein [Isosphaeraceae bacterium]|nr:HEAT repeat domain-containing protein [Isosphaeraceae bacterium]
MRALLLVLVAWEGTSCSEARADRIILRGGSEIKGVILPGEGQPGQVLIQTEMASKPIAFQKEQVIQVIRQPSALDEYLARRDRVEPTAEAQYEFGLWCEQHKLSGPAEIHYQKAVELDDDFGPAHKKLGHVRHEGRWMTYDEQREAQGLIKYKGRWISRQEKEQIEAQAAATAEQASWARRIKLLRQLMQEGTEPQRRQAEGQLAGIRDPAAVAPLVQAFSGDPEPMRVFLVQILGGIPGPEAAAALVQRILAEKEPAVRQVALDELNRRKDPETIPQLTRALQSSDREAVGRAAWALASLSVVSAVPKLIAALVHIERKVVTVPTAVPSPGGISASFSSYVPSAGAASVPSAGFGTILPAPAVLGPAVAPGVVAFGASSFPVVSGISIGLGGGVSVQPAPQLVQVIHRNPEVLDALKRLTKVDFGYDVAAWRRWLAHDFQPERAVERRVPQP